MRVNKTCRLLQNGPAYLQRHPPTLGDLRRVDVDVGGDRLQAEDEVDVGAAEVGFVHLPEIDPTL